ncbi:TIGR03757 family integrating conjugative element protein [Pseudomonas quasicaspiana]|uniref:TIGR03757 family integrating conjugative element protein n=1 Tax=Pseudomonas quasicaspiana TaxID=2829821 RepID=UPI001E647197|nr:TIGR03757 family integrating conjugative element protein [Pseudomonas quasicaspiana]MCD5972316.1 TIGR03757 family integrating conjugative element protein [Pseudomonas quasicaspiana]
MPQPNPCLRPNQRQALLILLTAALAPFANAETWVVTDRNHPVEPQARVRLILLDETERLEAKLSEGLPADPQQALAIIQKRLLTKDAQRLQRDLVIAQQNLVDAWSVGVTSIPAVVVDRKFVVYGETDVVEAEQRIAEWRERNEPGKGVARP